MCVETFAKILGPRSVFFRNAIVSHCQPSTFATQHWTSADFQNTLSAQVYTYPRANILIFVYSSVQFSHDLFSRSPAWQCLFFGIRLQYCHPGQNGAYVPLWMTTFVIRTVVLIDLRFQVHCSCAWIGEPSIGVFNAERKLRLLHYVSLVHWYSKRNPFTHIRLMS